MVAFILTILGLLLIIGVPIGFGVAVVSMLSLMRIGGGEMFFPLIPQRMFAGLDSFTFLAIPFFFLAGELMGKAKITEDLMEFSMVVIGRIRGGLAYANILASIFFAGITGAALADVAALGSIEIPMMEKAGYDRKFAAAITVASSIIGPIIPPSIIMVIYGSIMQVSIAALFLGGIIPGLVLALLLGLMSYVYVRKNNYPRREKRVTVKEFGTAFRNAILALIMPVILLGGILSGVFTPTEAAAVAAAYAFFIGFVVKKTLHFRDLKEVFTKMVLNTSVVFFVLSAASIFAWVLAFDQIPQSIAMSIQAITSNKYLILLIINVLLLFVGMVMDVGAALIVLAPIFAPLALNVGVHPLHFGIIMSINLMIGLSTPPVGPVLFATVGIADISIEELSRAVAPFLLVMLVFLLIITYVPSISMALPTAFGYVTP